MLTATQYKGTRTRRTTTEKTFNITVTGDKLEKGGITVQSEGRGKEEKEPPRRRERREERA
jgi:hypothetical protein